MAFPELRSIERPSVDLSFAYKCYNGPAFNNVSWLHHWYANDRLWALVGRQDNGFVFRFPDYSDFVIADNLQDITCYSPADVCQDTIRHLFLDQVFPVLLSHQGQIVLHASACRTPLGILGFTGPSGRGKSTLAAHLHRLGFAALTDDCLVVHDDSEPIVAEGGYEGIRLWPDSVSALFAERPETMPVSHYSPKQRVVLHGTMWDGVSRRSPMRAIYSLADEADDQDDGDALNASVSIRRMSGSESLIELVRFSFHLDPGDSRLHRNRFARLHRLVQQVPIYQLRYRRDFSLLDCVARAILENESLDRSLT